MKGDRLFLQALNKNLSIYLTSINQYFLHARIHKNWGFNALGKKVYHQSIDDMKSADKIIERILLLDGLPNLQDFGKLMICENAIEAIECDFRLESSKHDTLIEAIRTAEEHQDYVTRDLLQALKDENEEYGDWLETQLELIKDMGEQNYLQNAVDNIGE
jgi:bacterioferritin